MPRELRVRRRLFGKWQKLPKKSEENFRCVRGNCGGWRWTAENRLEGKLSNIDEVLQLIFLGFGTRWKKWRAHNRSRFSQKFHRSRIFFPNQIRSVFFSAVNKAGPSLAALDQDGGAREGREKFSRLRHNNNFFGFFFVLSDTPRDGEKIDVKKNLFF